MSDKPADLSGTLSKLNDTLEKSAPKTKREAREERREKKRKKELENASTVGGTFTLAVAVIMVGYAIYNPHMWWLIFVALGIGSGGARQLSLVAKKNREQQALPERNETDEPKQQQRHEIDALCDQLLSDLKESPEVVRAFLQDPEKTVEALRLTAKAVDQRRRDLSTDAGKERLAALDKQRADLKARRDGASDVVAREKFDGALRSLDGQEAALKQLTAVADRLDGEYTSLLVLLQELKTRVAVARSTNSTSQQAGLEQSVQRLNAELEAITDSLQKAQVEGLISPVDSQPMSGGAGSAEKVRE